MNFRTRVRRLALVLFSVALAVVSVMADLAAQTAGSAEGPTLIERFEIGERPFDSGQQIAIDVQGEPWVLTGEGVYAFDGREFRSVDPETLQSGLVLTILFGGPDRGLFVSQFGEHDGEGKIYRLEGGVAHYETTFYYDSDSERPGLEVTRDGRLLNWGEHFLAVYQGGQWNRIEARFPDPYEQKRPTIIDLGEEVYLYNVDQNKRYAIDARGEIVTSDGPNWLDEHLKRERAPEDPFEMYRFVAAVWNGDKVVIADTRSKRLFAFDIRTAERVLVDPPPEDDAMTSWADVFTANDGSTWLVGDFGDAINYVFFELKADGRILELPASRTCRWSNARAQNFRRSVLRTSDGTVALGMVSDGVALLDSTDAVVRWDWRHGVVGTVDELVLGKNGEIWILPSNNSVLRANVGDSPPAELPIASELEQISIVRGSRVWSLSPDEIAILRADQPHRLARLRSGAWTFQELPISVNSAQSSVIDERGHLLLEASERRFRQRVLDIGAESIVEHESLQDALAAAFKTGARQFSSAGGLAGIIVVDDRELWMGRGNQALRFDGERWDDFGFKDRVEAVLPSDRYGVIFHTEGGYYYYDRGLMRLLPSRHGEWEQFMAGPQGVQPFERSLAEKYPGRFQLLVRRPDGRRTDLVVPQSLDVFEQRFAELAARPDDDGAAFDGAIIDGSWLARAIPASEGAWLISMYDKHRLRRLLKGVAIDVVRAGTPLHGHDVSDVVQAQDGDVWITTHSWGVSRAIRLHAASARRLFDALPKRAE